MEFFELTAGDITALDDGQLRELVARLAEAELGEQGLPRSSVHAGGAQEAADGGLDVTVATTGELTRPNFVPRANTGFQVKKHSMGRSSCKKEMLDEEGLKPSIKALAHAKGAYVIVSGKDSCSAKMYDERLAGMREALQGVTDGEHLALDFYGSDRLALWLKSHPGVALWTRAQLGKPLAGWRPYGRWAATPQADKDEFLADAHPCVIDGSSSDKTAKPVPEGIQLARDRLRSGTRAVRITGLSGVGKTRFAQALFEEEVGPDALPALDVLYADLGEELVPSASAVVTYLIANKLTPYVVLDNCPPDVHRSLQKQLSTSSAPLHLLTIEYDISDDRPEETDVIHIEPGSEAMVAKLLLRRFKRLNQVNAARIAEFSGGNARVAIALADRVDADETLASFTDEQLFQRLFSQRKGESADLLRGATVLSLVYSFNVSRTEPGDELGVLAAISELPRATLHRDQAELSRRQLAQRRGNWRAVLPHALATRLAKRAVKEYEPEDINRELFKPVNIRLFQSCAHRLGYLHESAPARQLALTWVQPGAPLADIAACEEALWVVLDYVAPVFPDIVLCAIEQASEAPGFADRRNPNVQRIVKLLADLAYEDATFNRVAAILLKIARTERHGEKNNSIVSRLRQLLSLHLSGTMASPARRQAFVQQLLTSGDARDREIAGELLHAAFEAQSWTSLGGFHFGARKRGPGWRPSNRAERQAWYEGFLKLLDPLLQGDPDGREWAKSVIAAHFRQLWSWAGCFDTLEALVAAQGASGGWPGIWLSIGQTLEYDASELDPALLARLEALYARAAPTDLESEIGAYAFVDEWSRPRPKGVDYEAATVALRERLIGLGRALWVQPGLFERLAPQIWRASVKPVEWLGEGFAEAAEDRGAMIERVIAAFNTHAPDGASIGFLEGCLATIAKSGLAALPSVLTRLLEEPKLTPYSVGLLIATPMTPWASGRLIELARLGELPSHQFEWVRLGRRHESMSDREFASLLTAVCALPHGYLSALRMLVIRFHGRRERNYVPGPEIFAATRAALGRLLRDHRDNWDNALLHGLRPILVEALGWGNPDEEVQDLITSLCEGLRDYRLSFIDLSEVGAAFIQARPEMLLDALFSCEEGDSDLGYRLFRQRFGQPAPSLNLASIDRLLAWCGTDAQRLEYVAQNICVYESGAGDPCDDAPSTVTLSEHFKTLLDIAPDKQSLIEIAVDQAVPTSWMNSRVGIMEFRQNALRELLSHPSHEVQDLVRDKVAWLDGRIDHERAWEESDHHQREQRFE